MSVHILPLNEKATADVEYDACLAVIGYESRSRHFFETKTILAKSHSALIFAEQHVLDFDLNLSFFKGKGFEQMAANVAEVENWAKHVCSLEASTNDMPVRLLIDISSMSRQLISAVVYFLEFYSKAFKKRVVSHFVYTIARFGDIPGNFGPIISNGPSIKQLAGWSENPRLPCGIILGIGYEEDLALGLIEDLEAARVWAFRPGDHDPNYDKAINEKNMGLFDEVPKSNLIEYSVYDPYSLFVKLEALMGLSKRDFRIIIVPFGPKIFALSSCCAALCHYPSIGLWRVSGGINQDPVDRKPAGPIPSLAVHFVP